MPDDAKAVTRPSAKSQADSNEEPETQDLNYSGFVKIPQPGGNDESALWLSDIISEIWPYASNIIQSIIVEYIQPALTAAMPAGFLSPRFSKIDLGPDSPVVSRICVSRRKFGASDYAAVIEAEITYEGKPDIQMTLSDFSFGVNNVKLRGRIEVVVRPLLDRIPLIGALQLAFINRPQIDYKLTGLAAVANQSLINRIVRNVADSVLAKVAVLPNRVAYKSDSDVDYFTFSAQPVRVLRVAALCGKGFPSTDRDVFKQAVGMSELPDVYLVLTLGSVVVKTGRIDNSPDPVWDNQVFDFVLTSDSASQLLRIDAYDYDLGIGNDDFLGTKSVLLGDLIRHGISEIELEGSPEKARPTVKLAVRSLTISSELHHLQHAIMTQRSDTLRPKSCSALLLTVEVDEAHDLPSGKRPYVRINVGPHKFETHAAYDVEKLFTVENPEFEQSFHISLQGITNAGIKIEFHIIDLLSGEELGWAYSSIAEAVEAGPSGKTYNFALLGAKNPNASLRVRTILAAVLEQPPLWKVLADPTSADAR